MPRAVTLLLAIVLSGLVPSMGAAGAAAPIPASCRGFQIPPPSEPSEHSPYPAIGKYWPVDTSHAEIVQDERLARSRPESLAPVSIEDVRERLTRYVVVSREEWDNGFSHVAFADQGGWLATETECFQWVVRPGGLAWIVLSDGSAVYLAASRSKLQPDEPRR